jgi:hypothetical protein
MTYIVPFPNGPIVWVPGQEELMRHIVVVAACIGTLAGCNSDAPTGPPEYQLPPPPALEALPFDQIGSGTFVFLRQAAGLYVIDGSGRRSFPGLGNSRIVYGPSVAPDGRRIAFLGFGVDLTAGYDVRVANLDGTNEQRVATFDVQIEGPPSWMPNGSQIAFAVHGGAVASIYRQSPVSSPIDRVLLRALMPAAYGTLVCPYLFLESGPISVSGGDAIALNCMGREIDVILADGSATAAYTAGQTSAVHAPAWSPDGQKLAFIQESRATNGFETVSTSVIVVDPSGGSPMVLATVPTTGATAVPTFSPFSLCWLPGASGIMFTAPDGPATTHIFVVAVPSGVVTRVTSAPNVVDYSVSCSR